MLERIGLKVTLDIFTFPEWMRKVYIPLLDAPPEQQDWDLSLSYVQDYTGHTGASFLTFVFLDRSDYRWIQYDPVYEKMWENMSRTVDPEAQEGKIRKLVQHLYDNAYALFIYSPISLYAVNKELNFVPQKFMALRLKETSVTENHWSLANKMK